MTGGVQTARRHAAPLAAGLLGLSALVSACGGPSAPELPPRDVVGPPPEAALPDQCVPPYPMSFGEDWFLLADLDRGEACYVFLERDECVLGIFADCTDAGIDRRQWRGRVDVDTEGAEAQLFTVFERSNESREPRQPICCGGPVHATSDSASAWALLGCQLDDCGHVADVSHPGLYLSRYTPELDPSVAILAPLEVPGPALDVGFEGGALWVLTPRALARIDPDSGDLDEQVDLTEGRLLATGQGYVFVVDGRELVVRSASGSARLALPSEVRAMSAAGPRAVLAFDDALWTVDGPSATRTASAAAPARVRALAGGAPGYLLADSAPEVVFAVDEGLDVTPHFDTAALVEQTKGAFTPSALSAGPGVAAFLGPCHVGARKTHCVFETDGADDGARRYAVAGVEALVAVHHDPSTQRWVTVSEAGRITQVERGSGRPLLQGQVRLVDTTVRASAYDVAERRLFVLSEGGRRVDRVALKDLP